MNVARRYQDVPKPIGSALGHSTPRVESIDKVTGAAQYTDDLSRPGMLHAVLLGSAHAHARIRSIDVAAARALPGVKAVLTGADLPDRLSGPFVKDQPILARDKVRYLGEPIVAIAAVDLDTARAATRLVEIDFEELPAVFDAVEALRPESPVLHENRGSYRCHYELPEPANATSFLSYQEGDPEAAWSSCEVIVEGEYHVPAQEHMYLETNSTLAEVDGAGKLTLWTSSQGVSRVQALVADALDLPMSKVRCLAPRVGGGFGGKGDMLNQAVVGALALATRRPVKLTLTRDEDMTTTRCRHNGRIRIRTGARRDGTLVARSIEIILEGGAYADESPAVGAFAAFFARGPYNIPHTRIECWTVYTNRMRSGAFRGFGNPQATFAGESQLDELAVRLGIDPIDLRLQNALKTGDKWVGGQTVTVGSLERCLDAVRAASNWDERRRAEPRTANGKRRGLGVVGLGHLCAFLGASATVRMNEDGTVALSTGAQDLGQGSDTALAQIAAGTLGLPLDRVNIAGQDTDTSPYNFQTAGSRVTYMVGGAVHQAAERVREHLFRYAAEMLECGEEDLELRVGGVVGIKGVPTAALPFGAIAARGLYAKGGPISGSHDWLFEAEHFDPKRCLVQGFNNAAETGIFTFGAQVVEVEVDEATGQVTPLRVWAAHDVGRAINPALVRGQIEGAIAQGLGYGLIEELVFEDGRLVNPSMMDYKIPGFSEIPGAIETIILEEPEPSGPFGAKGIGEIGLVGPAPALVNAIAHATGARVRQIPASPERVLAALDAAPTARTPASD